MDIWQAQEKLGQRLLRWGILSFAIGAALSSFADRFWRGFGSQAAGWGLIDTAIAWLSIKVVRSRAGAPDAHRPDRQHRERSTLRRILWINAGLDVGYCAGGLVLTATKGRLDSFWRGSGWGIFAQGGFLLLFDLLHAFGLRAAAPVARSCRNDRRDQ
jgi:hypothetical protein